MQADDVGVLDLLEDISLSYSEKIKYDKLDYNLHLPCVFTSKFFLMSWSFLRIFIAYAF